MAASIVKMPTFCATTSKWEEIDDFLAVNTNMGQDDRKLLVGDVFTAENAKFKSVGLHPELEPVDLLGNLLPLHPSIMDKHCILFEARQTEVKYYTDCTGMVPSLVLPQWKLSNMHCYEYEFNRNASRSPSSWNDVSTARRCVRLIGTSSPSVVRKDCIPLKKFPDTTINLDFELCPTPSLTLEEIHQLNLGIPASRNILDTPFGSTPWNRALVSGDGNCLFGPRARSAGQFRVSSFDPVNGLSLAPSAFPYQTGCFDYLGVDVLPTKRVIGVHDLLMSREVVELVAEYPSIVVTWQSIRAMLEVIRFRLLKKLGLLAHPDRERLVDHPAVKVYMKTYKDGILSTPQQQEEYFSKRRQDETSHLKPVSMRREMDKGLRRLQIICRHKLAYLRQGLRKDVEKIFGKQIADLLGSPIDHMTGFINVEAIVMHEWIENRVFSNYTPGDKFNTPPRGDSVDLMMWAVLCQQTLAPWRTFNGNFPWWETAWKQKTGDNNVFFEPQDAQHAVEANKKRIEYILSKDPWAVPCFVRAAAGHSWNEGQPVLTGGWPTNVVRSAEELGTNVYFVHRTTLRAAKAIIESGIIYPGFLVDGLSRQKAAQAKALIHGSLTYRECYKIHKEVFWRTNPADGRRGYDEQQVAFFLSAVAIARQPGFHICLHGQGDAAQWSAVLVGEKDAGLDFRATCAFRVDRFRGGYTGWQTWEQVINQGLLEECICAETTAANASKLGVSGTFATRNVPISDDLRFRYKLQNAEFISAPRMSHKSLSAADIDALHHEASMALFLRDEEWNRSDYIRAQRADIRFTATTFLMDFAFRGYEHPSSYLKWKMSHANEPPSADYRGVDPHQLIVPGSSEVRRELIPTVVADTNYEPRTKNYYTSQMSLDGKSSISGRPSQHREVCMAVLIQDVESISPASPRRQLYLAQLDGKVSVDTTKKSLQISGAEPEITTFELSPDEIETQNAIDNLGVEPGMEEQNSDEESVSMKASEAVTDPEDQEIPSFMIPRSQRDPAAKANAAPSTGANNPVMPTQPKSSSAARATSVAPPPRTRRGRSPAPKRALSIPRKPDLGKKPKHRVASTTPTRKHGSNKIKSFTDENHRAMREAADAVIDVNDHFLGVNPDIGKSNKMAMDLIKEEYSTSWMAFRAESIRAWPDQNEGQPLAKLLDKFKKDAALVKLCSSDQYGDTELNAQGIAKIMTKSAGNKRMTSDFFKNVIECRLDCEAQWHVYAQRLRVLVTDLNISWRFRYFLLFEAFIVAGWNKFEVDTIKDQRRISGNPSVKEDYDFFAILGFLTDKSDVRRPANHIAKCKSFAQYIRNAFPEASAAFHILTFQFRSPGHVCREVVATTGYLPTQLQEDLYHIGLSHYAQMCVEHKDQVMTMTLEEFVIHRLGHERTFVHAFCTERDESYITPDLPRDPPMHMIKRQTDIASKINGFLQLDFIRLHALVITATRQENLGPSFEDPKYFFDINYFISKCRQYGNYNVEDEDSNRFPLGFAPDDDEKQREYDFTLDQICREEANAAWDELLKCQDRYHNIKYNEGTSVDPNIQPMDNTGRRVYTTSTGRVRNIGQGQRNWYYNR